MLYLKIFYFLNLYYHFKILYYLEFFHHDHKLFTRKKRFCWKN